MRVVFFVVALFWASAAEARDLSALSWLAGCWRLTDQRGAFSEVWVSPGRPVFFGYGVSHAAAGHDDWRQMRIEARGDDIVLFFMPGGRGPVFYTWSEMSVRGDGGRIRFDTEDRRFPQSIIYDRVGEQLTETVVDWRGGATEDFAFTRAECTAQP